VDRAWFEGVAMMRRPAVAGYTGFIVYGADGTA